MQMMRTMTAAHKHCPKAITGILVSIAALLSVVILLDKAIMTKEETFEYVIENQEELLSFVSTESFQDEQVKRYGNFCVTSWNDGTMIQFETQSVGLGSASSYKGFYYICGDKPVGFQGTTVEFSKHDEGLYWTDGTDNWMYVESILPHWYWFEAHF